MKNKSIVICLLSSVFFIFLFGFDREKNSDVPSHDLLERNFYQHETELSTAANLILRENLYRVEMSQNEIEILPADYVNEETEFELGKYLNDINISLISTSFKKNTFDHITEVRFYFWRAGFVFGGKSLGYAYRLDAAQGLNLVVGIDK